MAIYTDPRTGQQRRTDEAHKLRIVVGNSSGTHHRHRVGVGFLRQHKPDRGPDEYGRIDD
jgi:hypothetical protein